MDYYTIGVAFTMLALVSIAKWFCTKSKSTQPLNWPVLGMMPSLLWNITNVYEYAANVVINNGGTFKFSGPWMTRGLFEVVTSSPPNLEHVLKNEFPNFPRGPYFKSVFFDVFGDGLFTADHDLWKRQRKAVAMAMSSRSFRDQGIILLQKLLHEKVIPILDEAEDRKSLFDLQDTFLRLNFDIICITVLGKDPGCLSSTTLVLDVPVAMAFHDAIEACTYRLILPNFLWRCMRFLNVGSEKTLRRAQAIICHFASEMVKCKIEKLKSQNGIKQGDILSTFINLEEAEGRSPSQKLLQDLSMSILLAGRDTSALALSWFFWLLSMHPDVEQKIISEITQIMKSKHMNNNNNNSYDKIDIFGLEELGCMNYLQAAISETLRLYPPVPVSYRQAIEDSILPDGTHVKKGSKLLYFIYATNRMESLWGKDALEFKPERWINKDGVCMKEWDYKYPVFNAGPRLCLGRDHAYVNMKFMAANILARYKVKVVPDHIVKPKFGLTLFMKHGLKVSLDPREDILQ